MKVELMSPAGSYEALMSAIQAGCDAVYFGIEQLNMRARSSNNFTLEDLKKIAAIGKEQQVKMYLTLNTILYQHDMNLMKTIVQAAKRDGINAVIASDFAVMQFAKSIGMPVHISTQANVTNVETVAFFATFAD
jgi:putative protease